jgi:predicted transglutaminase-like cysteine proteinase
MLRDAINSDASQQEVFSDLTFELVRVIGYLIGSIPTEEDRQAFLEEINAQINEDIKVLDDLRKQNSSMLA